VIEQAANTIKKGGVVLHPSDTIYGLGCDPFQEASLRRIVKIKQRSPEKGFLVLIPGLEWVGRLCLTQPPLLASVAAEFWPGPLTILLEARPELSAWLVGHGGKIGIRWPRPVFLKQWLEKIGGPVVSTSANPSGSSTILAISEAWAAFGHRVDLVLDAGTLPPAKPSTVLDLSGPGSPQILRRGRLAGQIEEFLASQLT
jgi:L-threonylcarbamoyladenylate synthase